MLSTPVITAVRKAYPEAYIAFCAAPHARELIDTNPALNEVIILDKKNKHRGLTGMAAFVMELRKKDFDMALILHPAARVHIACFLAGVKRRIGYNRKWPLLLTETIPHTKQEGKKHEVEYNFDIIRHIGIDPVSSKLIIGPHKYADDKVRLLLAEHGLGEKTGFVAVHPGASCPSKRWPAKRFAAVIDRISDKHSVKVILIGGPDDRAYSETVRKSCASVPLDLTGETSIAELAALLSRASLLVSNDSGPVHIAVAAGTPVIAIFGRSDPGLSPKRWGPLGPADIVFHKNVGCAACLAHKCDKGFKCLEVISEDEVLEAVTNVLTAPIRHVKM